MRVKAALDWVPWGDLKAGDSRSGRGIAKSLIMKNARIGPRCSREQREEETTTSSEGQYRILFENNPLAMMLCDAATRAFRSVNDAAVHQYGYTREEFKVLTVRELHHPDDLPRLLKYIPGHTKGLRHAGHWRHVKKDGTVIDVEVTGHPLMVDRKPAWLVMSNDITERKRLEKEILEINERERQRLGQDLHDHLIQRLVGIANLNSVLCRKLTKQCPAQAADGARIAELLNQTISNVRGMVRGLFPVPLDANGLVFALQELARNVTQTHKIRCQFVRVGPMLLNDNATATHLYRICQEAVRNAFIHGKATRVLIRLASKKHTLRLTISNNGRDFRPKALKQRGFGLDVMRYRAASIGAVLDVRRKSGGGTIVTCRLHREGSVNRVKLHTGPRTRKKQ